MTTTERPRPIMLGVVGDSAAGKTTLTAGLVRALGAERVSVICTDDYHRYDRAACGAGYHPPAPGLQLPGHSGPTSAPAVRGRADPQAGLQSLHRYF